MKARIALIAVVIVMATVAYVTRNQTRLRLTKQTEVAVRRDIAYGTDAKQCLDVYAPPNAKGAPIVQFVHGGYWIGGDKDYQRTLTGLYGTIGKALAAKGIVTVIQNYRLVPTTNIEGELDDVMAALRWTEDHAIEIGGDPTKVYLMGHSAGGHLIAYVGSDEEQFKTRNMDAAKPKGYIALSAIWDIANMHQTQDAAFQERVTYPVFGKDAARWQQFSPQKNLTKTQKSFFIAVGENDYPYLIPQAQKAAQTLTNATLYTAKQNTHDDMVLTFGSKTDNLTDPIAEFIAKAD